MSDLKDLLEQERRRHTMPQGSLSDLERRRASMRRHRRAGAGLLAALVAMAGLGGALYAVHGGRTIPSRTITSPKRSNAPSHGTSSEALCASMVTFQGRTYVGLAVAVAPVEGVPLGSAIAPGCNDTGGSPPPPSRIPVSSFPGVSSSIALVMHGTDDAVLVRKGLRELPPTVRALVHAPACRGSDEPIRLSGPWLGILGANGKTELDLIPPYDVFIRVTSASSSRYERAHLTIRVPRALGHPISHADVVDSLWKGGSISITAECAGGRFVATAVQTFPPGQ